MRPHALLATLALTGCNLARIADNQTVVVMAPEILAVPDVGLGCATGAALAPVLGALPGSDKKPAHRALLLTELSAAMCAEPRAWDAELSGAVAAREGRAASAKDLYESERRHHTTAAARYWRAWGHANAWWGEIGNGECPTFDPEANEELLYMLGLSSGVLALVHDGAGGLQVGVPLDTPRKVERGAKCLDDDQWWGVPMALQAAVWASVPGAAPEGTDPKQVLADAAAKGDAAQVRLARAFQVQTLATLGDMDGLRAAITAHAEASAADTRARDPRGLLNTYATLLIQHESDRVWMAEAGHRTPAGALGTFPVDPEAALDLEGVDDLLDALIPEPEAAPAPPADEADPNDPPSDGDTP
jgi:hypothetical protein